MTTPPGMLNVSAVPTCEAVIPGMPLTVLATYVKLAGSTAEAVRLDAASIGFGALLQSVNWNVSPVVAVTSVVPFQTPPMSMYVRIGAVVSAGMNAVVGTRFGSAHAARANKRQRAAAASSENEGRRDSRGVRVIQCGSIALFQ